LSACGQIVSVYRNNFLGSEAARNGKGEKICPCFPERGESIDWRDPFPNVEPQVQDLQGKLLGIAGMGVNTLFLHNGYELDKKENVLYKFF
jgi:hypothetical protein